jgi:hypothetical protein
MRKLKKGLAVWSVTGLCALTIWIGRGIGFAQTNKQPSQGTVLNLKISTDQGRLTYEQGHRIPVNVQLTNVGSHAVFVGRDLWIKPSPSRVTIIVTPTDGHTMSGEAGAADGLAPSDDLATEMLKLWVLLSPGYSYGTMTALRSDLSIGTYKVRALFSSEGVDFDSLYNPLAHHPEEMAKFHAESWKGDIGSNELRIRIVASKAAQ